MSQADDEQPIRPAGDDDLGAEFEDAADRDVGADDGAEADRDAAADGRAEKRPDASPAAEHAALQALAERETAYGLLQRGRALMSKRHFAQAAVVLERAARLEPGKGSIIETLARARYNGGQHALAETAFRELLSIDPSLAYAHYGLGMSLKQLGRRREARTHLRIAVALAPGSRLFRDALARLPDPGPAS